MQNKIKTKSKSSNLQEWQSFLFIVFLALIIRILVMELFFVPSPSMQATILENEYIFSTKYSYGYSNYSLPFSPKIFEGRIFAKMPQRGDIIVFRPPHNMDIRYIKRLIGLPGDKIQLINDIIYINDKKIERKQIGSYISEQNQKYIKFEERLPNDVVYFSYKLDRPNDRMTNKYGNTEIFCVPTGKYFFLGDNRDESRDSRVDLGFVPFENFIAKGQFILFSTQQKLWIENISLLEQLKRVATWLPSIRVNRIFKSLYTQ